MKRSLLALAIMASAATQVAALTNKVLIIGIDGTRPDPPFSIVNYSHTTVGWRVEIMTLTNRLYSLERAENLNSWSAVTPWTAGSGGVMALTDSSPPAGQAFYRVTSRRP